MRLLFFSTEFPHPYDSTKAVFNLRLVQALAARHEVKVVAPIPWVEEVRGRVHMGNQLGRRRELVGRRRSGLRFLALGSYLLAKNESGRDRQDR